MAKNKRALYFLLLTGLWLFFIFFNSSRAADSSSAQSGRYVTLAADFIKLFTGGRMSDGFYNFLTVAVRKAAHAFSYFTLAFFVFGLLKSFKISLNDCYIICALSCGVAACADEILQYFIEGRFATVFDVCYDMCGAVISLLIVSAVYYFKGRQKTPVLH